MILRHLEMPKVEDAELPDLVRFQEMTKNDEVNLAEIGVRYATTPQSVLSAGVGFGISFRVA